MSTVASRPSPARPDAHRPTPGALPWRPLATLVAAGAPIVFLSFHAGGFFPGTTAVAVVALCAALLIRMTVAAEPLAGLGRLAGATIAAFVLFAGWTLMSALWSDSPARALVEFDRALLYSLTLLFAATFPRTPERLRWVIRGVALGITVVAVAALITRLLPNVWPIEANVQNDRLSYPITYWNGLGLIAGAGVLLLVHLASDLREPRAIRLLAAGLAPLVVATMYFTFSRGAFLATAVGLVLYVALARSRGLLTGLGATLPASVLAVVAVYRADALATEDPTTALAVSQGHRAALVLAACAVGAVGLRAVGLRVDRALDRGAGRPAWLTRGRSLALGALAVAVLAGAAVATDAPQRLIDRADGYLTTEDVQDTGNARDRITVASNSGRLEHWRVALDAARAEPLHGAGAGTYANLWAQNRRKTNYTVLDAHSLYVEVLGELGVVGLLLVAGGVLGLLAGATRLCRGPERALGAIVVAAIVAWALEAGIDWMWELPAVSIFVFILGGTAIARPAGRPLLAASPPRAARLLLGVACIVLAIMPLRMALSQRTLTRSAEAFSARDCGTAIRNGLQSISDLSVRPEPYALVGFCDSRLGEDRLAIEMLRSAIERDPDNWEFRYGLALVLGSARQDPRPAMNMADRLNHEEPKVISALNAFYYVKDPAEWRRLAREQPVP